MPTYVYVTMYICIHALVSSHNNTGNYSFVRTNLIITDLQKRIILHTPFPYNPYFPGERASTTNPHPTSIHYSFRKLNMLTECFGPIGHCIA